MVNPGAGRDNVLLAEGGLVISQTRLVSDGDTYAMASISSCRRRYSDETDDTKKFLLYAACIASIVIGVVIGLAIGGTAGIVVGLIFGVVGLIGSFLFIKPGYELYHVICGTNTGEIIITSTRDPDFAERVDRAINDAIIARG